MHPSTAEGRIGRPETRISAEHSDKAEPGGGDTTLPRLRIPV